MKHPKTKPLFILLAALVLISTPSHAADIHWGVCAHPIGNPYYADYEKQFEIMQQNHLTTYRMDVMLTENTETRTITETRKLVELAKKRGIAIRPILQVAFFWGDRTDAGHYKSGDQQALYQQGFDRTYNFVRLFKDDIRDWEFANEVNLRVSNERHEPLFGYGWEAKEFDTSEMKDWSYVFKGMSDAITRVNANYGSKLRRVLGTTSTNFGFIDYMQAQGVAYDVLGYHYYAKLEDDPYNAWSKATPPYNLFKKLGSYGKPVHFTEVNAFEIYDRRYENKDDADYTQKGYKSLARTIGFLRNQTDMKLEEVDLYELVDEPTLKGAEAKFGLMYNLDTPKAALSIVKEAISHP